LMIQAYSSNSGVWDENTIKGIEGIANNHHVFDNSFGITTTREFFCQILEVKDFDTSNGFELI